MRQYILDVDNTRGHPRFTLYQAIPTGAVADTSDTATWTEVASDNSPFTATGLPETIPANPTFTLTATE